MPVKPVPSDIGGLVMGVDVAAAGSGIGSVVVIGEGDAWRPEALGAPSKVGSFVRSSPCSFFFFVHFKVRTGPQKGSSGEENTQSTLHMPIGPYRILYVLPALLGVCVV